MPASGRKLTLTSPVAALKNVGKQRALLLSRLHIFTVRDLVHYYPRDYLDRSRVVAARDVCVGEINTVSAVVDKEATNAAVNGRVVTRLVVSDESNAALELIWFNQPYMQHVFKKGDRLLVTGPVTRRKDCLVMASPDYEKADVGESLSFGRITPVYAATAGLTQKLFRALVKAAFDHVQGELTDVLPASTRARHNLCGKREAVANIHFPEDKTSFLAARRRLVFEELFLMQTALFKLKGALKRPSAFVYSDVDDAPFLASLPFVMTHAQQRTLAEVKADFQSGTVMNRLIQGDVGSGKTAVAMAAIYIAVKNGGQAALMAPT